jgi:putative membrane protein
MSKSIEPVSRRYAYALLIAFAILWVVMAIAPKYREDWAVENILVAGLGVVLFVTRDRIVLSKAAVTMLFVFMCTHVVGSHYTYAEVPYDAWARALTGTTLNDVLGFERNHFDRFQHFCYGFLLSTPIREVLLQRHTLPRFASYALPVDIILSSSLIYELIEWLAVLVFGAELGAAYLGTQGDPWDAHADMALAGLGALIAMTITYLIERSRGTAPR